MKKVIIIFLFLFGQRVFAQDTINAGFVKPNGIFLRLDSLNKPIFKDDSLLLNVFLVFNHNVNEITSISFKVGDVKDSENGFSSVFNVTSSDGKYFISGPGIISRQLNYGSNLIMDVRCKKNENFKWVSIYYQKGSNIKSSTKYFKING